MGSLHQVAQYIAQAYKFDILTKTEDEKNLKTQGKNSTTQTKTQVFDKINLM